MNLFRVTLTGCGLRLCMENASPADVGFVKNEYVVAESKTEATTRAIERVKGALQTRVDEGGVAINRLDIRVDEVVGTLQFWKVLFHEGFVFFPRENESVDTLGLH